MLFVDAVAKVFRGIAALPDSFSPVLERPGVRRAILGSPFTKFVVYFHTDADRSLVLAVLHSARHPDTWQQ